MRFSIHHFHLRRRARLKKDPYPHPNPWISRLDTLVLIVGILGPLFTIPQIHTIFFYQHVAGLSLTTWALYAVFNTPWIIYGIIHKAKPVTITYTLWFIVNSIVVAGILMYS